MRRIALLLLAVAAGCGTADDPGGGDVAKQAVQTATLTGLYRAGEASELCILDRGVGNARFGLVVREAAGGVCSGAGAATRAGAVLRLTMAGDEPCEIEAAIAGRRVAFPAALPAGCAYYCAPGASMAGASLVKVGGAAADAMRARDLVGDPLCA